MENPSRINDQDKNEARPPIRKMKQLKVRMPKDVEFLDTVTMKRYRTDNPYIWVDPKINIDLDRATQIVTGIDEEDMMRNFQNSVDMYNHILNILRGKFPSRIHKMVLNANKKTTKMEYEAAKNKIWKMVYPLLFKLSNYKKIKDIISEEYPDTHFIRCTERLIMDIKEFTLPFEL